MEGREETGGAVSSPDDVDDVDDAAGDDEVRDGVTLGEHDVSSHPKLLSLDPGYPGIPVNGACHCQRFEMEFGFGKGIWIQDDFFRIYRAGSGDVNGCREVVEHGSVIEEKHRDFLSDVDDARDVVAGVGGVNEDLLLFCDDVAPTPSRNLNEPSYDRWDGEMGDEVSLSAAQSEGFVVNYRNGIR